LDELGIPRERVAALDAARGFALLGVAIINAHAFNTGFNVGNYAWNAANRVFDQAAELISNLLFAHRSLPVLAFLLGVGLVVQTQKLPPAVQRFEWPNVAKALWPRYAALGLIGIAHGLLLWPGEILTAYALIVLTLARYALRWQPRTLDRVLAFFLIVQFGFELYFVATERAPLSCKKEDFFSSISFAQSNWFVARRAGISEYFLSGLLQSMVSQIWTLVLLGIWAGRSAWFWAFLKTPSLKHPVLWASAAMLSLSTFFEWKMGIAGGWSTLLCQGGAVSSFSLAEKTTGYAVVPVIVAAFALLSQLQAGRTWWQRLIAVGRAPITMFVGQSVVLSILFSHSFFGLHASVGRGGVLVLAVLTYWMLAAWIDQRYFQYGRVAPGEQFWRWLTLRLTPAP
jgi:uncharacterized protein